MTLRVFVIGLGGQQPAAAFSELLDAYPVAARAARPALDWLGGQCELADWFDDLFQEANPVDIEPAIIQRLADGADGGACVYLVPGSGQLGDATVAALAGVCDIEIRPGFLDLPGALGSAQIIDALELALAEQRFPFEAGLTAPDPARPAVITNLRGDAVAQIATRRIRRAWRDADLTPDASGTLYLQPSGEPGAIRSFAGFERIVSILRSPEGCPWDREQTAETLIPMMLEEVEELREAFLGAGPAEQADELGDVLLHIVMIAQLARELHGFGMEEVLEAISAKMVRRHPHVFGDVEVSSIEELYEVWQSVKDSERAERASGASKTVSEG